MEAVIFDLDDTLLNFSERFLIELYKEPLIREHPNIKGLSLDEFVVLMNKREIYELTAYKEFPKEIVYRVLNTVNLYDNITVLSSSMMYFEKLKGKVPIVILTNTPTFQFPFKKEVLESFFGAKEFSSKSEFDVSYKMIELCEKLSTKRESKKSFVSENLQPSIIFDDSLSSIADILRAEKNQSLKEIAVKIQGWNAEFPPKQENELSKALAEVNIGSLQNLHFYN